MNFEETGIFQMQKVQVKNLLPEIGIEQAQSEIIAGLTAQNRYISSKFFYNEKGSQLFEEITHLKEYYPTVTEKAILKKMAPEMMNRFSDFEIVELGSGDCSKISILLAAIENAHLKNVKYIPVDFSKSAIEEAANELTERFPTIKIEGFVADFIQQIDFIPPTKKPRLICFFGSTIGNFIKDDSITILKNLAKALKPNDSLLVGFDRIKDENILHAAYNDSKGITEAFNKNILQVVNSIIKSDFNPKNFEHVAFFNTEIARIEMHLKATKNCTVSSPYFKKSIQFKPGNLIHTENSHKYSIEKIVDLIRNSDLKIKGVYSDSKEWFSLVEFQKTDLI